MRLGAWLAWSQHRSDRGFQQLHELATAQRPAGPRVPAQYLHVSAVELSGQILAPVGA